MTSFFCNVLRNFDSVSDKYNVHLDRNDKFKTLCGGCISVVILAIIIVLFYSHSIPIFYHQVPNFGSEKTLNPNNTIIQIDPYDLSKFSFAFRVEDEYGQIFDDRRYFDYGFANVILTQSGNQRTYTSLSNQDPVKCDDKMMLKGFFKSNIKSSDFYCINWKYSIGGSFREVSKAIPVTYVKPCDASTETKYSLKCATSAELKAKKLYFLTLFQESYIDSYNYTDPLSHFYSFERVDLDLVNQVPRRLKIGYSKAQLRTDEGDVFPNYLFLDFFEKQDVLLENVVYPIYNLPTSLITMEFAIDYTLVMHFRDYGKIVDRLGMYYVLRLFLLNIVRNFYNPFLTSFYGKYIISKFFRLEIDDDKSSSEPQQVEIQLQQKSVEVAIEGDQVINKDDNTCKDVVIHEHKILNGEISSYYGKEKLEELKKNLEYLRKKKITVEPGFCDLFISCNCCYKKGESGSDNLSAHTQELVKLAKKLIDSNTSLEEFHRRLNKAEFIESIMLDREQATMLRNFGRKILTNRVSDINENTTELRDLFEEQLKESKQQLKYYMADLKKKNEREAIITDILYERLSENFKNSD